MENNINQPLCQKITSFSKENGQNSNTSSFFFKNDENESNKNSFSFPINRNQFPGSQYLSPINSNGQSRDSSFILVNNNNNNNNNNNGQSRDSSFILANNNNGQSRDSSFNLLNNNNINNGQSRDSSFIFLNNNNNNGQSENSSFNLNPNNCLPNINSTNNYNINNGQNINYNFTFNPNNELQNINREQNINYSFGSNRDTDLTHINDNGIPQNEINFNFIWNQEENNHDNSQHFNSSQVNNQNRAAGTGPVRMETTKIFNITKTSTFGGGANIEKIEEKEKKKIREDNKQISYVKRFFKELVKFINVLIEKFNNKRGKHINFYSIINTDNYIKHGSSDALELLEKKAYEVLSVEINGNRENIDLINSIIYADEENRNEELVEVLNKTIKQLMDIYRNDNIENDFYKDFKRFKAHLDEFEKKPEEKEILKNQGINYENILKQKKENPQKGRHKKNK